MTLRDESDSGFKDLGHALHVTELPPEAIYCVSPCTKRAWVPSVKMPCSTCGQDGWVDERSVEMAKRCARIVCMDCLDAEARAAGMPTP